VRPDSSLLSCAVIVA